MPEWCQETAITPWHGSLANPRSCGGAARDIIGFVLLHNSKKSELQAIEWGGPLTVLQWSLGVEIWEDSGSSLRGPGVQPLQRAPQSINSIGNLLLRSCINMEKDVFSNTFNFVREKVF